MFLALRFRSNSSPSPRARRAACLGTALLLASCAESAIGGGSDDDDAGDQTFFDAGTGDPLDSATDQAEAGSNLPFDANIGGFDATVPADASVARDAGMDAGARDAGTDAGVRNDAGVDASVADAGRDAGTDAGSPADAGGSDASIRDGGSDAGGGSCTAVEQCTNTCDLSAPARCCDQNKCGCTWAPGFYCNI